MRIDLDIRTSPLLRTAVAEGRFDVWEFYDDGDYSEHRVEKEEVEAHARRGVDGLSDADVAALLSRHARLLKEWVPDRVKAAQTRGDYARLCAFAELQWALSDAQDRLDLLALDRPRSTDPTFEGTRLFDRVSRDGLLEITPENVRDPWVGSSAVFFFGGAALFPHAQLAPYRELLHVLATLAHEPGLAVYVAVHPFRRSTEEALEYRLLHDRWDGMHVTPETLDSLDRHDTGTSFHWAGDRSPADEFLNPLLGTSFDWRARRDDAHDPVKRLYIREVKPPETGRGPLAAVHNRELHAERDTKAHYFQHVDGKICRYPTETYAPSSDSPRAPLGTPSHSRKLWRVDGALTDERWSELVGLFFRGNELIEEHLREAFPAWPTVR